MRRAGLRNVEGFGLPGMWDRASDKQTDIVLLEQMWLVRDRGDHEGGVVQPELLIFIS